MAFQQISILGMGLMGGSVGLACKSLLTNVTITGYSNKINESHHAVQRGAIDHAAADLVTSVAGADLIILCTPVGQFRPLLQAIASSLQPHAIVTDVGSTKRLIVRLAEGTLLNGTRFVGSHPMVGGEKHGIENARADLLQGSLCILTPDASTDPIAVKRVEEFWQSLKMRTLRLDPETHDQMTAEVSHLPHAVAAALVRMQSPSALDIAGRGFLDITRIAAGDPALWSDILLENRDHLKAGINRLQHELTVLMQSLDTNDPAAVQRWLAGPAALRRQLEKSSTEK